MRSVALNGKSSFLIGLYSSNYRITESAKALYGYFPDVPGIGLEWNEDAITANRFDI